LTVTVPISGMVQSAFVVYFAAESRQLPTV